MFSARTTPLLLGSESTMLDAPAFGPAKLHPAFLPPDANGSVCYVDSSRTARCASGQTREHIVFVGDSITRYQFIALALSFERGHELDAAAAPSPVIEHEWLHWMHFFNGTTAVNARCDCHRSRRRQRGATRRQRRSGGDSLEQGFDSIENRYYHYRSSGTSATLNLSYFSWSAPAGDRAR